MLQIHFKIIFLVIEFTYKTLFQRHFSVFLKQVNPLDIYPDTLAELKKGKINSNFNL